MKRTITMYGAVNRITGKISPAISPDRSVVSSSIVEIGEGPLVARKLTITYDIPGKRKRLSRKA